MKPSFVIPILVKAATELGIRLEVEPRYGYVARLVLPDGGTRFMRNTVFDLNGAGATEIAKDKDYASYFLEQSGYPTPIGDSFHTREWAKAIGSSKSVDAAWEYAKTLGMPVFVKPNSKSQGAGVSLARNKREFYRAVARASKNERVFLVQKPVIGKDYRIVCLDGEVISAYERVPLIVTGDGTSTIRELLDVKQEEFIRVGRDTVLQIDDPRITSSLDRSHLTRESVLPSGQTVTLLPNANLSSGGNAIDATDSIHPDWRELSRRIARDMNLRYIGIDIIMSGTLSDPPQEYCVIEINAAPGIDNYASIGEEQTKIVERLYREVLIALAQ